MTSIVSGLYLTKLGIISDKQAHSSIQ